MVEGAEPIHLPPHGHNLSKGRPMKDSTILSIPFLDYKNALREKFEDGVLTEQLNIHKSIEYYLEQPLSLEEWIKKERMSDSCFKLFQLLIKVRDK